MPWQENAGGPLAGEPGSGGPVSRSILGGLSEAERAAHQAVHNLAPGAAPKLWPWIAGAIGLAAGAGAAFGLEHFARATVQLGQVPVAAAGCACGPRPFDASVLIWPGLAALAVLAAYYGVRALAAPRRTEHAGWHGADPSL